jgi:hypothetical protein
MENTKAMETMMIHNFSKCSGQRVVIVHKRGTLLIAARLTFP